MSHISLTKPIVGQPDKTEDPKVTTALTELETLLNGGVDGTNITEGALGEGVFTAAVKALLNAKSTGLSFITQSENYMASSGQLVKMTKPGTILTLPSPVTQNQAIGVYYAETNGTIKVTASSGAITGPALSATSMSIPANSFATFQSDGSFWRMIAGNSYWPYAQNFSVAPGTPQVVGSVRPGALVRLTTTLVASWGTTTEGSFETYLYRDGSPVWTPGQRQRFGQSSAEGQGHGNAVVDMPYIETTGGEHTYEWILNQYGTSISVSVLGPAIGTGLLAVGP